QYQSQYQLDTIPQTERTVPLVCFILRQKYAPFAAYINHNISQIQSYRPKEPSLWFADRKNRPFGLLVCAI
ncbi:MAG: hypothetical protein SPJ98_01530, partial [Sodaliphilus sp.]|nr:hypothetical protein [Sodaliphilus sp.]